MSVLRIPRKKKKQMKKGSPLKIFFIKSSIKKDYWGNSNRLLWGVMIKDFK